MTGTTRRIAVFLTCVAVASSAAAQDTDSNQDSNKNVERQADRVLRQRAAGSGRQTKAGQEQRRSVARGRGQADITEGFSQTVRLVPGGTFDLRNASGDVTITGGGRGEARIEAVKRVRDINTARARAAINQLRIEVVERGGNVEVRTISPRGPSRFTVNYTVVLPENANLILRSTSGNFHVQRMAGDELNADTISGNVNVRDVRSRMLELHTVMGNMQLHDVATQRALLTSMAGSLEFVGRLMRAGRYDFQTHGGNIRVVPSGDPGFDLEAMTVSGDVRSDFVLRMLAPQSEGPGPRTLKVLRGRYGNAGAAVTATTFSGIIEIAKP